MSEIKVNKISPRSGTAFTLGDSGDTFTIPSGATINNQGTAVNFGATGSASWVTTVKTSTFTAVAGEGYFVNTTGGVVSVNLPAGVAGAVVAVKDYAGTFDTNAVTLVQNGSDKIGGSTVNATLGTEGIAVTLVFIDSTQGWLVTDDGLQSQALTNPFIVATGGTITESGNDRIHTFTGPGTFAVTQAASSAADNTVSHIVVASGGGGGNKRAGGGGAGGYREVVSPSSPYTGSPLNGYPNAPNRVIVSVQSYGIVVGGAGVGGVACGSTCNVATASTPGNVSTFSTITSAGGGTGGGVSPNAGSNGSGGPGGSGGGGFGGGPPITPFPAATIGGVGNTPPVSPAQGFSGGVSRASPAGSGQAGGGGGATVIGKPGNDPGGNDGDGGDGASNEITGSAVIRAGGGGGGSRTPGTATNGGPGGGGNGSNSGNGTNATANTGGGGGGMSDASCASSGNGGSGIVIIRYKFQ